MLDGASGGATHISYLAHQAAWLERAPSVRGSPVARPMAKGANKPPDLANHQPMSPNQTNPPNSRRETMNRNTASWPNVSREAGRMTKGVTRAIATQPKTRMIRDEGNGGRDPRKNAVGISSHE